MLLRSPSAVTDFLGRLPTDAPLLLVLATNGQRPGDPKPPVLRGVSVCAGTPETTAYVPVDALDTVKALVQPLMSRSLLAWNAYEEALAFEYFFGALPPISADVVLGRNVLRHRVLALPFDPPVPKPPTSTSDDEIARSHEQTLSVLHSEALSVYDTLREVGQRVPYEIELYATLVLAQAAARGYRHVKPDGAQHRVHPTWHTSHPSGALTITAAGPSLTSVPVADRRAYPADPHCRWVQIEWVAPEVTILAGRTGAPWLKAAAAAPDPYGPFCSLWDTDTDGAKGMLRALLTTGPDEATYQQKHGDVAPLRQLAFAAPEWVEWGARLTEAAKAGTITTFLGRALRLDEPRKACALDVQATQGLLLRLLINRLHVEAQTQPRVFANFHGLLPVFNKVAYQIDVHVPLAHHVPAALHLGQLVLADGLTLRPTVAMGPTWGQLTVATEHRLSQVEQDLLSPASVGVRCPVCLGLAPDEPTLRQHAAAEHGVVDLDDFVERATTLKE